MAIPRKITAIVDSIGRTNIIKLKIKESDSKRPLALLLPQSAFPAAPAEGGACC